VNNRTSPRGAERRPVSRHRSPRWATSAYACCERSASRSSWSTAAAWCPARQTRVNGCKDS